MKYSRYNILTDLDKDNKILYNTLNRNYYILNYKNKNFDNLFKSINNNKLTKDQYTFLQKLINKEMIVKDDLDEVEQVKDLIYRRKYSDRVLYLNIQTTLNCNFRCIYCYEKHENITMDDVTSNNIIKYIENNVKYYDELRICWFGGEPSLEFQRLYDISIKVKEICKKNGVIFDCLMVTNGYLLDKIDFKKFLELPLKQVQITVDGIKQTHNKMRPLAGGGETYNKVISNIIMVSQANIQVALRVNINEDNYKDCDKLFDEIPLECRKNMIVELINVFQSKERKNFFEQYLATINKGYKFSGTGNSFLSCEQGRYDTFNIRPNGEVSYCSVADENGLKFGYINEHGKVVMSNPNNFFSLKNINVCENKECIDCIELPMCAGGCVMARYQGYRPSSCRYESPSLSLNEKVLLHYYYDAANNNIKESDYL